MTCGKKTCRCKALHHHHQMVYLESVLERLAAPLALPEELAKLEKRVDGVIDGFIRDLEELRVKHKAYIEQHLQQYFGNSALRAKLIAKERLEKNEATGDCFSRMLQEMGQLGKLESPYKLPADELERRMSAVHQEMAGLCSRIEQWWHYELPKFRFSETLKYS